MLLLKNNIIFHKIMIAILLFLISFCTNVLVFYESMISWDWSPAGLEPTT